VCQARGCWLSGEEASLLLVLNIMTQIMSLRVYSELLRPTRLFYALSGMYTPSLSSSSKEITRVVVVPDQIVLRVQEAQK
jgi:hypothetical protein